MNHDQLAAINSWWQICVASPNRNRFLNPGFARRARDNRFRFETGSYAKSSATGDRCHFTRDVVDACAALSEQSAFRQSGKASFKAAE